MKKEIKLYKTINYNGHKWYAIKLKDNSTDFMREDCLSKEEVGKHFTDCDSEFDVCFSNNNSDDWQESVIREGLRKMYEDMPNKDGLVLMKTNYDEDKCSEDYMRIPTAKEVNEMPLAIRKSNSSWGYWTISPYYFNGGTAGVWFVNSIGNFGGNIVNSAYGVRPVISLKSEIIESLLSENENN